MWIRLLVLVMLLVPARVESEPAFVVIVHAKNPVRGLDRGTVADMFLKKRTQWNDDLVIQPVDQVRGSSVRKQFSEQVVGRSVASVRVYWNRLVFSGRAVPPPELATDDEVVKYVAKHAGAIGYVSTSVNVRDAGVKVIEVR